jgi:predicted phage terminase large subunit-like protein
MTTERDEHGYLLSPLALAVAATSDDEDQYQHADHLQLLSMELVQLHRREPGWPRRLLVTMPPRHGKSELCSHWLPVWMLALQPKHQVILCSYEAEYAARYGRKCRRTVEELYPIIGAKIMEDSRAAHRWETAEKGGMVTAGVGGPITGRGGNLLILDDPVKNAEEASSQVIRENLWDWWTTTFLTREQPRSTPEAETIVVLIMTRWHEDDLAGRIMATPDFKRTWRHINLPALAEPGDVLERPEGAALWPEMFGEEFFTAKRAEIGSRPFTALYQQRPTPPGGSGINRLWWKWYDDLPPMEDCQQQVISVDPTFKDVDSGDFVAIQVWGRWNDEFRGLDGLKQRMASVDAMRAIKSFREKWPKARIVIEETASGAMICDLLERELGVTIDRVRPKGSKDIRLNWAVGAAAPFVERGKVFLPRGAKWAQELVEEGAAFPHGSHDDAVDAFTQGIARLIPRSWAWERTDARIRAMDRADNPKAAFDLRMRNAIKSRIKELASNHDIQARLPGL